MDTFSDELWDIHDEISISDADRRPYTEMFDTIRNWLTSEMCKVDTSFKNMFKGTKLFGSYQNRVRIVEPSEFDVFILLDLNIPLNITTYPDRPGFVEIRSNEWKYLNDDDVKDACEEIFSRRGKRSSTLNRNKFQNWIKDLIEYVLENSYRPTGYEIYYNNSNNHYNGVAHTIKVKELYYPYKKISIDFVVALKLDEEDVAAVVEEEDIDFGYDDDYEYLNTFVAIPKPLAGCGPKKSRRYSFQLVNPDAECDLLWDKQNLKVVYRLLKSLRNNYKNLRRLKSYFLTAMFLQEVAEREETFWQESIGHIFMEMLSKLIDYLNDGFLPFYWSPEYNLLAILKPDEITKFSAILTDAFNRLTKLYCEEDVTYTVDSHFKTS